MTSDHRRWHYAAGFVLMALWLAQSAGMVRQGNWGWVPLVRSWRRSLVWRSARFYWGPSVADKVTALNAVIPSESLVVLPPLSVAPSIGRAREMEWFLFPRHVTNCTNLSCLQEWSGGANAFVVWPTESLPLNSVSPERWVPLSEGLGVVVPVSWRSDALPFPEDSVPLTRWLFEIIAEGSLLGIMFVGGIGLLTFLERARVTGPGRVVAAWALGSGVLTIGVYGLLLLGIPLKTSFSVIAFIEGIIGFWAWKRKGWATGITLSHAKDPIAWGLFLLLMGWASLLSLLAVGKGYHATDALGIWAIKGYGIAHWGLRQGTYLGFVRDYPLHIPLLIALPKALWGDITGISKLVFPGFFLGILILLFWEIYRFTKSPFWAFWGSAFWATVPIVVRHAEIAYANLPMSFYFFVGLWLWFERKEHLLAGLVLAWGVWTRPEGWALVGFALLLGGLLESARLERVRVVVPPLTMFLFWLLTRRLAYAYRYVPGVLKTFLPGVIAFVFRGEVYPKVMGVVLGAWARFLWWNVWGVLGGLALIGVFVVVGEILWISWKTGRLTMWECCSSCGKMILVGLGSIMVVSGIYYFTAYLPDYDIHWWIDTGFDRMNLPAMIVLWYGIWQGLGKVLYREGGSEREIERGGKVSKHFVAEWSQRG